MQRAGFESLLEESRLLAIMELSSYASSRTAGELIELGVYKGGSAAITALSLRRHGNIRVLHLCDTFGGMPETLDWEFHRKFDFSDTSLEYVSARLAKLDADFPFQYHQGLFSQTLPSLTNNRFCFAHIDADLYESVKQACEFVYPRMEKGGLIVFDDYGAPTCRGAKAAVDEYFADKLETPTHVASCAYGIRVGSASTDFRALISKRVMPRAGMRAAYLLPFRLSARILRKVSEIVTGPRLTKMIIGPFIRSQGQDDHRGANATSSERMVLMRTDTLGDLVLFSPFLRELRRSNQKAKISLVVQPRFANIVELCPYVDEILTFDHIVHSRLAKLGVQRRAFAFAKEQLEPKKFDLALLPRWGPDFYHSTYLAYFSGASTRIGYSEDVSAERKEANPNWNLLLTRVIDSRDIRHEVQRNLDFLRELGGSVMEDRLELWLSSKDLDTARQGLRSHGITSDDLVIGIAPGAGHPKRMWRLGSFVELGRELVREFGVRILIVGGTEDGVRGARLKEEIGVAAADFTGKFTLRETAALLKHAQVLIANDSGPMHLGAAVGTAIVEISCHPQNGDPRHVNSPIRFGPWRKERVVLQPAQPSAPCLTSCEWPEAHCILSISTERVLEAARDLLSGRLKDKSIAARD